jgi:hypothetical protein
VSKKSPRGVKASGGRVTRVMAIAAAARPRWTAAAAVALLSTTALVCVAMLALHGGQATALDELNPFGSVQDQQLPAQLGQPPTLSAMLHTDYPPGFNRDGQPTGPADRLPPPPRQQQMSYVGIVDDAARRASTIVPGADPRAPPGARGRVGAASMVPPASPATNTWREHRAGSYPLYASDSPPPAQHPDGYYHPTPRGAFSGPGPHVGASKAERDYWSMAQGAYWRSLDHFYRAEAAASNSDWIARRSGWASQGPEAASHAAVGDKILDEAQFFYNQGKRVAGGEQLASAHDGGALRRQREAASAERDYMQALVYLDKSTKAAGGTTTAGEWDRAQAHWDYFYQTNRVLDGKQQALDAKRAQALRQFLPRSDATAAVKIDAYVVPWVPFPACVQATPSKRSSTGTRALRALRRLSNLHALRHKSHAKSGAEGSGGELEAVCYAANALRGARSPIGFTASGSAEGQTLQVCVCLRVSRLRPPSRLLWCAVLESNLALIRGLPGACACVRRTECRSGKD